MTRIWLSVMLLIIALAIAAWDVFTAANNEPENSVSATLYDWAAQFPVLPYALGIITGHLFWPHVPRVIVEPPVPIV